MRDIWNFRIVEAYNEKKFEGVIDVNANIGDELATKNPEYNPKSNPDVPQKLYYYPIKVGLTNYVLPSDSIETLPIKVQHTTKISIGQRGYHRIDRAASVKISAQKMSSYKEFIDTYMPYNHSRPHEWTVWKIICERSVAENFYLRAISYPSWGKTSSFYVMGSIRNDIEILDNSTYAKMKYSLSVKPRVLVLDEVDDIDTETRRSLSKIFRNAGGGMGKLGNDSRAVSGTTEIFDLSKTSVIALYNFPDSKNDRFFDNNFHPKVLSRLFPVLLDGGGHDKSPLLHIHTKERKHITESEQEKLDNFLKNCRWYEEHWHEELVEKNACKITIDARGTTDIEYLWKPQYNFEDTRWQQTYSSIVHGLMLYAETQQEFHRYENTLMNMHKNYMRYKDQYNMGMVEWNSKVTESQETVEQVEEEIL